MYGRADLTCMHFFSSTFSHSVIASVRVKVLSFRDTGYLTMRYFSSWSSSDECNCCGCISHGYSGVVAPAAGGAGERQDRVLQAAVCGVWERGLWGYSGQTEPDVLRPRWVEAMDGVPDLGAGGYQRGRRAGFLSGHCAHSWRRYVLWRSFTCQLVVTLNLLIIDVYRATIFILL